MKLEDLLKPNTLNDPIEEHDPTVTNFDLILNHPGFENSVLQESMREMNNIITDNLNKQITEELDERFPNYLINDPEIVGYPDKEMQEEIYEWVVSSLPKYNFSIKDLGSGRCDFYRYIMTDFSSLLDSRVGISYHGIESNPNLCNVAKYKYPDVNVINNNYFDVNLQTDYTILIGTLNTNEGINHKWDNFNKTLIYALNNTNKAIIFVLARNMDGLEGYFDYPFEELFQHLHPSLKFTIDYSKFEDIYKLVVHIDNHNN